MWFFGDLLNFFGAIWAGLVPTVIVLAIYFCIADTILIAQCLYYKSFNSYNEVHDHKDAENSTQPLLAQTSSDHGVSGTQPASLQRPKPQIGLSRLLTTPWVLNTASVMIVCAVGTAGWAIAWQIGAWKPTFEDPAGGTLEGSAGAEILGYVSAFCYLGFVLVLTYQIVAFGLTLKQCKNTPDRPKLSRQVMRGYLPKFSVIKYLVLKYCDRAVTSLLYLVSDREPHLRCWRKSSTTLTGSTTLTVLDTLSFDL